MSAQKELPIVTAIEDSDIDLAREFVLKEGSDIDERSVDKSPPLIVALDAYKKDVSPSHSDEDMQAAHDMVVFLIE